VGGRLRPRRSAGARSGGSKGDGTQVGERLGEAQRPGPPLGHAQGGPTGAVHEAARHGDVAGAQGASDDEGLVVLHQLTERRPPAHQVVRQHRAARGCPAWRGTWVTAPSG